jgi:hypothetical protein
MVTALLAIEHVDTPPGRPVLGKFDDHVPIDVRALRLLSQRRRNFRIPSDLPVLAGVLVAERRSP